MPGLAVVAAAVVLASPIAPMVDRAAETAAVQLSAALQPPDVDALTEAFASLQQWQPDLLDAAAVAPMANALAPIGDAIIGLYNTVEPWVAYGVNLVAWAAGWVPFVGLLAPQINIFYDLGESVVQSLLFNTIYWLDGTNNFGESLSLFGSQTWAALQTFAQDQVNWVLHFLPPFPPIGLSATGLDLGTALPDLTALPGAEALGAISTVGTDLTSALSGLLLSLFP